MQVELGHWLWFIVAISVGIGCQISIAISLSKIADHLAAIRKSIEVKDGEGNG